MRVQTMNIVYISHLKNNKSQGPYYSVPAQVHAQSMMDNVFWYNISEYSSEDWHEVKAYHQLEELSDCKIKKLPEPFNKPDLVIFEDFYIPKFLTLSRELNRHDIPYIIIPRGALTKGAQRKKRIKKIMGNAYGFKSFAKGALAIQYLTNNEKDQSGDRWNKNSIIIPNGVSKKSVVKGKIEGLNGCYIGRMDPYHKGLDILIEVCQTLQNEMRNAECTIKLYGPERLGCKAKIEEDIKNSGIDDILIMKDGVFGKEKEKALLESDFFIMTSRFEGHPTGLIEALSYGLPCLVSKGTNMSDEINHHDAGWTAETSKDSIIDAFKRMLSDRDKFTEKGINALTLSSKYNWLTLANESRMLYSDLLKRR